MAMNINNLSNANAGQVKHTEQQSQVKQQAAQTSVITEQAKTAAKDSVSLTPQAKQLGELQKKAADEPVMNQKKIDEIKKKTRKIWSGVFTPSGEVDFTLNRGGIRQGMLQGGPPRDDPSPILIGKIH